MTTVGLLLCGHVHPDVVDAGGDYPELFAAFLAPFGLEVVTFDATAGNLPASIDDCDAWIASPSRWSMLDAAPWLDATAALVVDLLAAERPLAGICFGHQLLASVAGGRVERAAGGWGVGAQRYEVVDRLPWMDPPLDRVRLIASHEDQVVTLPPDARLLATSGYCPNAMFALGERVVGIQAHPEFTAPLSHRLIGLREELIGADAAAAARASLATPLDRAVVGGWLAHLLAG